MTVSVQLRLASLRTKAQLTIGAQKTRKYKNQNSSSTLNLSQQNIKTCHYALRKSELAKQGVVSVCPRKNWKKTVEQKLTQLITNMCEDEP